MPQYATDHPILSLDPEDLDLIMALVLEGSSLKGLAARYGVSYPTIRTRLDRVIAREGPQASSASTSPRNNSRTRLPGTPKRSRGGAEKKKC